MSQNVSASVAQLLERLVEENRELQARQSQDQAIANLLSPYLGDISRLLSLPTSNNYEAPVAAPVPPPGLAGLQSGGAAQSDMERAIMALSQELLQQEAAERARQAMQQSQKDIAQQCIASLLIAAQLQQQQELQAPQQIAPPAPPRSDQVPSLDQSRQPANAQADVPSVVAQVIHEPPQQVTKKVPLKKRPAKKERASKPAKKKSTSKKSAAKKQAKVDEEPDALSYPCRCRGLPENHNARTAFIAIPNGVVHGQALRCSHPICRSRGVRFRYCSACRRPVAKRNFSTRHNHTEAELLKENGEICATVTPPSSQAPSLQSRSEEESTTP